MSADLLHPGHINVLKVASSLGGRVVVGVLTDAAAASFKRLPYLPWEDRKAIVSCVKGVDEVIAQESFAGVENLKVCSW